MKITQYLWALFPLYIFLGCTPPESDPLSGEIVDLTHSFGEDTIFWPTAEGFKLEVAF